MKPLFKLIKLLSASEKRNLALLTVAMVVMAVFEVLGVGAVGPFISVAANALTTFVMYWVLRWSHMRGYSLAGRLLSQYLYQPYA